MPSVLALTFLASFRRSGLARIHIMVFPCSFYPIAGLARPLVRICSQHPIPCGRQSLQGSFQTVNRAPTDLAGIGRSLWRRFGRSHARTSHPLMRSRPDAYSCCTNGCVGLFRLLCYNGQLPCRTIHAGITTTSQIAREQTMLCCFTPAVYTRHQW